MSVAYAPKGLVGVLTPQANTTVEPEFAILTPPGHAFVNARLTSDKPTIPERLRDYFDHYGQAAQQFANAPVSAIGFACTGASYLAGTAREDETLRGSASNSECRSSRRQPPWWMRWTHLTRRGSPCCRPTIRPSMTRARGIGRRGAARSLPAPRHSSPAMRFTRSIRCRARVRKAVLGPFRMRAHRRSSCSARGCRHCRPSPGFQGLATPSCCRACRAWSGGSTAPAAVRHRRATAFCPSMTIRAGGNDLRGGWALMCDLYPLGGPATGRRRLCP